MKLQLQIGLTAALLASTASAQAQMRFQNMDSDNDGVITRAEWRGTAQSFRSQDWNEDGVLSGDEVVTGAQRPAWSQDWNRDGRVDTLDNQIAQRYRGYDANGDNRVARTEWPGNARLFARLDTNRDGYVTMNEYSNGAGFNLDGQGGPAFRFANVDLNGDGWVTRSEWNLGAADFNRLDANRDNRISRFEFDNDASRSAGSRYAPSEFNAFDSNRDGWITRSESRMSSAEFGRFDVNNDNRVSRFEFDNVAADTSDAADRSQAWRMGRDRGALEGRVAGREDYVGYQRFDLDGQRELERADSGYTPQMGSLSDYQAGYREGFREAYREGFDAARAKR